MANGGIRLTGPQMGKLSEVIRAAFPDPNRLDQVLLYYLEINRANLTLENDYPSRLYDILVDAKASNWTHKFIAAARQANPDNPDLLAFAQDVGLATAIATVDNKPAATVSAGALEKKIKEANGYLDVNKWRTALGQLEGRVCKIEVGNGTGTGFIVGSDTVMTNYHVMEAVIKGDVAPGKVTLQFDYKRLANDELEKGTVHRLAADWRIHDSRYSEVDLGDPTTGQQEPDRLDYALLRVEGRVADEPVGGAGSDPKAPPRGFIPMPPAKFEHDFKAKPALFILQHPDGEPLKLALDTESVIAVNDNGARVRYRTNTEPGSSGSPCFDADWNLVALHHLGDRNWKNPQFNQGVPFKAILGHLEAAGKASALGEQ